MAANPCALQMSTVRKQLPAWVATLPVAIVLSDARYWIFSTLF